MTMVMTMERRMSTRTIKASEFKAKCLKLMDEVNASGDTLTVTKNGKPVVEVRPATRKRKSLWGLHAGQGKILGDIISPAFEEDDWDMLK
jgi:prevent-host-death family protein